MREQRRYVSTDTSWEQVVGFSRAIRVGRFVSVSGTTATDDAGQPVGVDDAAAQTECILEKIAHALKEVGSGLADVTRTRIYVRDAGDWQAVGRVHGRYFRDIRPANTLVEVSRLVGDEYLVEIEADAILPADGPSG